MRNKDSDHQNGKQICFSAIINCSDGPFLYLYPGSHHFVFYRDDIEESQAQKPSMGEMTIPPNSLFTGDGYLKHTVAEWSGKGCHYYHINLIPEDVQIKGTTDLAFVSSLSIEVKGNEDKVEDCSIVVVTDREASKS